MSVMNHPEYQEHFENEDFLKGREYISDQEFNPFLHKQEKQWQSLLVRLSHSNHHLSSGKQ